MQYRSLTAFAFLLGSVAVCPPSAAAQAVVGEVFAADASLRGSVVLTAGGTQVMSGSSISAGSSPARLKLARGGEVRVCPGTQLGVNASASGRELMLALSSGSLEAHYPLDASADSIVTPDFRLMLAGPGEFHLAVAADARGDTCVRSLAGSTASVIINEQIGDGIYQLRPGEEVLFRAGKVSARAPVDVPCGCPPPPEVKIAETKPPEPAAEPQKEPEQVASAVPVLPSSPAPAAEPAPVPAEAVHVQVDAPFIFHADEAPDPLMMASIRLERPSTQNMWPTISPPEPAPITPAAPPPAQKPKKKRGWFRSFLAAIFR